MDPGEGGNSLKSSDGLKGLKPCLDLSGRVSSGELWEEGKEGQGAFL